MGRDVFQALADPTRRGLLDLLRAEDGQDITTLAVHFPQLSRFGVAKHLGVLAEAGLVTVVADGRHHRHYLNPVPLQELHDRWLTRFTATTAQALLDLRARLEQETSVTDHTTTTTVYRILIRTTTDALWAALTSTGEPRPWMYDTVATSDWQVGSSYAMGVPGADLITGVVLDADPPRRLVLTFDAHWDDDVAAEPAGQLSYEITEDAGVCTLVVTISGVTGATAESVAADTPEIYSALKTLLETGTALRTAS